MAQVTISRYWNHPRYKKALLKLYGKTAGGSPHGFYLQAKPNLLGAQDRLVGDFAQADIKTKLQLQEGARIHAKGMHDLDARSRGLDITQYEHQTDKKLRTKRMDIADRGYWPHVGLGVGSIVVNRYLDKREAEKRKDERKEDRDWWMEQFAKIGGNS